MNQHFTVEEKRKFRFQKHIKNHLFEYILDLIGPVLLTLLILYLCGAERYLYGIALSAAYSAGRLAYRLRCYKKEYIDLETTE